MRAARLLWAVVLACALVLGGGVTAAPARAADAGGRVSQASADGLPFPDRLVMNRIQTPQDGTSPRPDGTCCIPANVTKETATARITNTGTGPLTITAASVTAGFTLVSPTAYPVVVAPGASSDVVVRFVATGPTLQTNGTLSVTTDDPTRPTTTYQLAGRWQQFSEGGDEPNAFNLVSLFGYTTKLTTGSQSLDTHGAVSALGQEVLSPYWVRADRSSPVTVRQLAAFHTQGSPAAVYWHAKGSTTSNYITASAGVEAQTVLPRTTSGAPAQGSFTTDSAFGFRNEAEWSDDAKNDASPDIAQGCSGACGHHVRFYPAHDRSGHLMANTWLMLVDSRGINFDYQDNVYLITNARPETAPDPSTAAVLPGAPSTSLGFAEPVAGTLADASGSGTGFPLVQANKLDTTAGSASYRPAQLQLGDGALRVTTTGTSTTGSNEGADNTGVNVLETPFDASAEPFTVTARLVGPFPEVSAGSAATGVHFGRGQDDFVRLAVTNVAGVPKVRLYAESGGAATVVSTGATLSSSVTAVDLLLVVNPRTGVVTAWYRPTTSGTAGALTKLSNSWVIPSAVRGVFLSGHARAGILAQSRGTSPFTASYDSFAIAPGDLSAPEPPAIARIDVGSTKASTDALGRTWSPDTGLFSPSTAVAEGASTTPAAIANTEDDALYATYRGNVGSVAQAQRSIAFSIPTGAVSPVTLRLHFAERSAGNAAAGRRVFSVAAEGTTYDSALDLYAAAGGVNTAITLTIPAVTVSDGRVDLVLKAARDHPAVSAIEVLGGTGADTTAPGAPSGVAAAAADGPSVAVSWAKSPEPDVVGYRVHRAASSPVAASGTPVSGTSLVTGTTFTDSSVSAGSSYAYAVVAVDASGNASPVSSSVQVSVPAAPTAPSGPVTRVNFQDAATPVPSGYLRDSGEPYGQRTGADQGEGSAYGWVAMGTSTPVDNSANGRARTTGTATSDVRLNTYLHMQKSPPGNASWELAVPEGTYEVTVVVGDAGTPLDSTHQVTVEGSVAVGAFRPTSAVKHATGAVRVAVTDGRLTLSPVGGINTKIDYVEVAPV
ncbi:malectin domain-containing carbohydrate-binding protein [Quadrisphaera sp. DSM 44207]|uniref:malectin domain-containing carbohydrate-binding protein n=1 Tax=Quadrisphaera sp. DSM 44207 TaxID=1881057 RepID=UPI00088A7B77|nr:malectin domain-containing carbohydrate-binding protein [Quadrisphaera sp. DSM 44207]SDQ67082.1 Di-glucose binding within endoplasmic reticulum [Quadrisphaera sp. DSM 44207]